MYNVDQRYIRKQDFLYTAKNKKFEQKGKTFIQLYLQKLLEQ